MTEKERAHRDLLAAAHRTVRFVGDGEGPYPGRLVSSAEGAQIAVDVAWLAGWEGWKLCGASHIAVPLDLARRADGGHDVLLPWCPEQIGAFLRRRAVDTPLAPGERTTLIASLLRGFSEAKERELRGEWWLTGSGRPVFVIGEGVSMAEGAARIVSAVRAQSDDRSVVRLCHRIEEALSNAQRDLRVLRQEVSDWEEALCALAAPKPLRTAEREGEDSGSVGGARGVDAGREAWRQAASLVAREGEGRVMMPRTHRERGKRGRVRRKQRGAATLSILGERISFLRPQRTRGARRAESRRKEPGRGTERGTRRWKKPVLVGMTMAAVLAVGGALWPQGEPADTAPASSPPASAVGSKAFAPPDNRVTLSAEAEASESAPSTAVPGPESAIPASGEGEDASSPLADLPDLLRAAETCAGGEEETCAQAWAATSRREPLPPGLVRAPVSLVEDYGGVAVMRAQDGSAAWMLVLVRVNAGWRVQDVYDVPVPPSDSEDQAPR